MGTLAACSLAMRRLRTRPRTDVDPPRESNCHRRGAYRLAAPGAITCFRQTASVILVLTTHYGNLTAKQSRLGLFTLRFNPISKLHRISVTCAAPAWRSRNQSARRWCCEIGQKGQSESAMRSGCVEEGSTECS